MSEFERELSALLNRYSKENESNTPDSVLAGFLMTCLRAFNEGTMARDTWYAMNPKPGEDWVSFVPRPATKAI